MASLQQLLLDLLLLVLLTGCYGYVGDSCSQTYSCVNCNQVRVCQDTWDGMKEVFRFTCSGSEPFCNQETGLCSSTATSNCADTGLITCIRDGEFPDLHSCDKYHVCYRRTAQTYHCPNGQKYGGNGCSDDTSTCEVVNCSGKSSVRLPHPINPAIFVFCLYNQPLFIDQCEYNHELNVDTQQCESVDTTTMPPEAETTEFYRYGYRRRYYEYD